MSASHRPIRPIAVALLTLVLVALVGACNAAATTPQPRPTISFLVRNATNRDATYRFTGSATLADVSGPLSHCRETTIGTTWDPVWTFDINGLKAVASTDSADLQPGASAIGGLTVIVVIDASGVRATDVHPGAPDAGDTDAPSPCG